MSFPRHYQLLGPWSQKHSVLRSVKVFGSDLDLFLSSLVRQQANPLFRAKCPRRPRPWQLAFHAEISRKGDVKAVRCACTGTARRRRSLFVGQWYAISLALTAHAAVSATTSRECGKFDRNSSNNVDGLFHITVPDSGLTVS